MLQVKKVHISPWENTCFFLFRVFPGPPHGVDASFNLVSISVADRRPGGMVLDFKPRRREGFDTFKSTAAPSRFPQ